MKREKAILIATVSGIFFGLIISSTIKNPQTECEKTEQTIRENSNLSGALACFPPGVIQYNATEEVDQRSELECICRRSLNGQVQLFAINRASP